MVPVDPDDFTAGAVCTVKDITEQKEAEARLLESEERYRIVVENSNDGIVLVKNGKLTYVNQRLLEIFGFEKSEDIIGESPSIFVHADDKQRIADYTRRRRQGEPAPTHFEYKGIRKDGTTIFIEISVAQIIYHGETITLGYLRDITERKRAEEALRESENKFRDMAEKSIVGIYVVQDKVFKYVNAQCAQIHGYEIEELIDKKTPREMVVSEEMPTLEKNLQERMSGQAKSLRRDFRIVTKTGEIRYVETYGSHTTYQGKPATIGTIIDVTERKQAEEALKVSEDRFRTLIEKSREVISLNDENRKRIYVSPSITNVLGYSAEEYLALKWYEVGHPDEFEMLEKSRHWLLEHPGETVSFMSRLRHKDGHWCWMEVTVRNFLHDPSVRAIVVNFRDITERKNAEEALRKSEEKFRNIFENAIEGIFQTTPEGKFLSVNPALARMHGFESPDELMCAITADQIYVDPQDRERMLRLLREREVVKDFQTRMYKKDGNIIWVSVTSHAIKDAAGKIEYHEGVVEDITEKQEAEKNLLESEERYRTAIEHSNDGVALIGDKLYLYVNQKFLEMFGYDKPEDVIGKPPMMTVHPDDAERLREYGEKRQQGEAAPERYEYKGIRKDSTIIFIEVSVAETMYQGRPVVLSYLRDVSKRRLTDEALKRSEEHFRTLIEKSSEVIFLTDKNRKRIYVSPSITRILGYTAEEFLSFGMGEFTHPDDTVAVNAVRSHILANPGETVTFVNRLLHKDGSWRWVETTMRNLLSEPSVGSLVANFHDITERKLAEEALRESENKFRDLTEKSFVGIYIIQDNVFQYVNARFAEIHGYTIEEIINRKNTEEMILPGDLQSVEESLLPRGSGTARSRHNEFRIVTKTGKVKHVETYGTRTIFQGKPATIGAIIDITERKQVEEALRKSEEKYRNIFENAVDGIFQTTPEGQLLSANPALARLFGFNPSEDSLESVSGTIERFYANMEDRKVLIDRIKTCGSVEKFEIQLIRIDGNKIWASVNARAVYDENGGMAYFEGTITDITNRKNAEEALVESETKYRNVVDNLIVGFYLIQDNRFRFVNRRFCEMSGYSYDELVNEPVSPPDLIHDDDKEFVAGLMKKRLTGEIDYEGFVYKGIRKDGQVIILKGLSSLLLYNGRPAIAGTIIDITRERTLESQLQQAQKMEAIGTLAGGIAHDFNNILTAIIGYGKLLQMKMAEADPLREYVAHMLSSSEKAANLTRNLLTFSRKQIVELRPVEVGKILKGMERLLKSLLMEDIELEITVPDDDITIMADISQIEQILLNLASNANDAMPRGGILTIEVKEIELKNILVDGFDYIESGRYASIAVADSGTGIDEENRNKIFEPFFTTKEVGKGTGLGLSIVHGIVEQHHGYITVDSKPQGGTVFSINFPVVKMVIEETKVISPALEGGSETILVAEDDEQVRNLTVEILNDAGYAVIEAINGVDAIEKYVEHSDTVELLLLDVVMPKKNGKEAYDEIKQIKPDIRVIFMSGYTGDVVISKGIVEREYAFIQKPLIPDELLLLVRKALGR